MIFLLLLHIEEEKLIQTEFTTFIYFIHNSITYRNRVSFYSMEIILLLNNTILLQYIFQSFRILHSQFGRRRLPFVSWNHRNCNCYLEIIYELRSNFFSPYSPIHAARLFIIFCEWYNWVCEWRNDWVVKERSHFVHLNDDGWEEITFKIKYLFSNCYLLHLFWPFEWQHWWSFAW